MIESKAASSQYLSQNSALPHHKVLKMVKSERMAGSIPVWEDASSPSEKVQGRLSAASVDPSSSRNFDSILDNVLNLQDPVQSAQEYPAQPDQEFGFGDLIDMVNPLHHVPIAGEFYRDMTGDEIKPISKIIGASLFGGPVGGGSALVNMIVEHETGQSVGETVTAALTGREYKPARYDIAQNRNDPETALSDVTALLEHPAGSFYETEMPGSVMSYADLGAAHNNAPSMAPVREASSGFGANYATPTRRYNE